jgi:aryl-alcohol dehydrogenase-like predicted oxidoreductase
LQNHHTITALVLMNEEQAGSELHVARMTTDCENGSRLPICRYSRECRPGEENKQTDTRSQACGHCENLRARNIIPQSITGQKPMQYTQLGKSGLMVSRICLGCMSYGNSKWRPWILDEPEARPFYKKALDLGINFFDTADMYSMGASEGIAGRALRDMANMEEIVLATKVHFPMGDGPNMGGLSRKHILQGCDASLKRLGVDTIDLYQIHRFKGNVPIEETLAALNHLVEQGKVRYIGASSGYAWQMSKALSVSERKGWARFISMQNHYNLVYREEEREMIPLCEAEGIGVIPWSPLARGRLARTTPSPIEGTTRADNDQYAVDLYDSPSDMDVINATRKIAEEVGVPPAQVALAWLLSKPAIAAPIIGATKPGHLETAVASLDVKLTDDQIRALEAPYRPHAVRGM